MNEPTVIFDVRIMARETAEGKTVVYHGYAQPTMIDPNQITDADRRRLKKIVDDATRAMLRVLEEIEFGRRAGR